MKGKSESEVAQSCPTLHDPMDCSPPGSSIHGIFQARVLEWGAIAFSGSTVVFAIKKLHIKVDLHGSNQCSRVRRIFSKYLFWSSLLRGKSCVSESSASVETILKLRPKPALSLQLGPLTLMLIPVLGIGLKNEFLTFSLFYALNALFFSYTLTIL